MRTWPSRAALALLAASLTPAAAETISSTRYDYYPINGQTAAELYAAMLKRGPHVDGDKAYASTSATSSQVGKLLQAKSCSVQSYTLKIDFVIHLPRLGETATLAAADRKRFAQFLDFLKRHEEQHRAIWMDCAADLEAKASHLSAASCSTVDAKAQKLWTDMRKACSLRHQAFDAAEQKRLLKHPFLQYVMKQRGRSTRGAKVK